jgi:nitrogen fixation-related uncharacterized protein
MTTLTRPPIADDRVPSGPTPRNPNRAQMWVTLIFGLVVFIPCALGFGNKLLELIQLSKGDAEGRFALTPVVNYLLATLGFLCMFLWGAMRGTFHDVEEAKQRMLDDDRRIDEESQRASVE